MGGRDGAGESRGERKRDSESVGETDDDVANGFRGFEVAFDVGAMSVRRVSYVMHFGSVVQDLWRMENDAS